MNPIELDSSSHDTELQFSVLYETTSSQVGHVASALDLTHDADADPTTEGSSAAAVSCNNLVELVAVVSVIEASDAIVTLLAKKFIFTS